jgi:hypothetical protein
VDLIPCAPASSVRIPRGVIDLRTGKAAQGGGDLGAVYADDRDYEDVAALLRG